MSKILIINNAEPEHRPFIAPLEQVVKDCDGGTEPDVIDYREASDQIDRINAARAVILSGVPFEYGLKFKDGLKTAKDRQHHMSWLDDSTVRVLGICAGHQVIAVRYGVDVGDLKEGETGNCRFKVIRSHKILDGLGAYFEGYSDHWASAAVPPSFVHLAKSLPGPNSARGCNNQVMVDTEGRVHGCQFHPEKSGDKGRIFLKNFIDLAPLKKLDTKGSSDLPLAA